MNDIGKAAEDKEIGRSKDIITNETEDNSHTAQQPKKKKQKKSQLNDGNRRLLFLPEVVVRNTDRHGFISFERRFKSVYSVPQQEIKLFEDFKEDLLCEAMILDNNIALIVFPFAISTCFIEDIHFNNHISDVSVSGKFKKGAKAIDAGNEICSITVCSSVGLNSGENRKSDVEKRKIIIKTPIAGKIVDFNEELKKNPNLLFTEPKGDGYLLVLSTEAPKFIEIFQGKPEAFSMDDKVCYSWLKGQCMKGGSCKFLHSRL
jgi:hypothetical protein